MFSFLIHFPFLSSSVNRHIWAKHFAPWNLLTAAKADRSIGYTALNLENSLLRAYVLSSHINMSERFVTNYRIGNLVIIESSRLAARRLSAKAWMPRHTRPYEVSVTLAR
jgi:hypothetical protein